MQKRTTAAAAAALAALVTGCGSGGSSPSGTGPLRADGRTGGSVSACARPGQPAAFGTAAFRNDGSSAVRLDRVSLRDPKNLRLVGVYAVPGQNSGVGAMLGWPPRFFSSPPQAWNQRKPVPGYRLPPGKWVTFVVGIAASGKPGGHSSGTLIDYRAASGSYLATDHAALVVNTGSCP